MVVRVHESGNPVADIPIQEFVNGELRVLAVTTKSGLAIVEVARSRQEVGNWTAAFVVACDGSTAVLLVPEGGDLPVSTDQCDRSSLGRLHWGSEERLVVALGGDPVMEVMAAEVERTSVQGVRVQLGPVLSRRRRRSHPPRSRGSGRIADPLERLRRAAAHIQRRPTGRPPIRRRTHLLLHTRRRIGCRPADREGLGIRRASRGVARSGEAGQVFGFRARYLKGSYPSRNRPSAPFYSPEIPDHLAGMLPTQPAPAEAVIGSRSGIG